MLVTFTLNEVHKRQLLKYAALWHVAQLTEFGGGAGRRELKLGPNTKSKKKQHFRKYRSYLDKSMRGPSGLQIAKY